MSKYVLARYLGDHKYAAVAEYDSYDEADEARLRKQKDPNYAGVSFEIFSLDEWNNKISH